MTQDELKVMVAKAALEYIPKNAVLGVGSGSTVMKFIEQIGLNKVPVVAAVSSSNKTTEALTKIGVKVVDSLDKTFSRTTHTHEIPHDKTKLFVD